MNSSVMLILQKYDFDINNVPRKLITVTDTLNRATLNDKTQTMPDYETAACIHSVVYHLSIPDQMIKTIIHETYLDPIIKTLCTYLLSKWPSETHQTDLLRLPHCEIRNETSLFEELTLK